MPRAYCHACGAEVPVDDEGRCHVGHEVDVASSGTSGGLADAARAVEAEYGDERDRDGRDEDGGPDAPASDGPRWLLDADLWGDDDEPAVFSSGVDPQEDLEPAERPEAVPPDESEGWDPPTETPIAPGPQPPPEPAAPPPAPDETEEDEDSLDDLETAIAELEGPTATDSAATPLREPDSVDAEEDRSTEDQTVDLDDWLAGPLAAAAAESRAEEEAATEVSDTTDRRHDEPTDASEQEQDDDEPEDRDAPVDLSSFTARGDKVGKKNGRRSLFRLGR